MKYPIGIQSFEKIRQGGYVYVDKTDLVYKLAKGSIYFLARPRRFGKSLLVSTLKAYFEGRRDLFEGLKIAEMETEWTKYPVISFDFNLGQKNKENGLRDYLLTVIAKAENTYGIAPELNPETEKPTLDAGLRFNTLLEQIHLKTGQRVVVLIDEYDKPLLDLVETGNPDDEKMLSGNRELLKYFFSVFKAADSHLRFVMLTGITKFSQVSMFSGFNQPDDISLVNRYDTLLGITEQELHTVFAKGITELAEMLGKDEEETKQLLKQHYDGYHFSKRLVDVYNPFSILNTFANLDMKSYWFTSGTPSYMVRLLSKSQEEVMTYTGRYYPEQMFVDYKADTEMPLPMFFQSGYLTIKAVDERFNTYLLDYPNNEVKQGMITLLANQYLQSKEEAPSWVNQIIYALEDANLEQVRKLFTSFLAETPYSMRPKKDQKDRELYFHYTFYLLMRLISCYTVYTEKQLSEGRVDCIVETPKYIFVFEFKLDGTAEEALKQINDRGYAKAYEADPRPLYKIGASFSSKTGTIEDWKTTSSDSTDSTELTYNH
ncbi:MAG: ATP-binding protein [Bacteroidaceae bacterium]|nr:ATP-binding protein [Bacteroidaceae bacterium]